MKRRILQPGARGVKLAVRHFLCESVAYSPIARAAALAPNSRMSYQKLVRSSACIALLLSCTSRDDVAERRFSGAREAASPKAVPAGTPAPSSRRNIILIIGDGMQLAHEVAASRYLFDRDDGLSFHQFPKRLFKATWDVNVYNSRAAFRGEPPYSPDGADPTIGYDPAIGGEAPYPLVPDSAERYEYFVFGPYPDSASTGTAMSTGVKTDSNNIAWRSGDPEDGAMESSPAALRRVYGMATGFVTTVPFTHATPATFFSHNTSRSAYFEIQREMLFETLPDVIIGGAGPSYVDPRVVLEARNTGDWLFVGREPDKDGGASVLSAAFAAIRERKRLLALFGAADGSFTSPIPSDTPGAPTVRRGAIEDPTLADASLAALEVLSRDPDGFFLLIEQGDIDWSNHNNDFSRMVGCVWDLHEAVESVVSFVERDGDDIDWSNTTVLVTADHANSYLRLPVRLGAGDLPAQLGIGSQAYPDGEVIYHTGSHTSELVTLYAIGDGAELLEDYTTPYPGLPIVDDTAIYHVTMQAARR